MKWTSTKSKQYPANEQEVFICVDGKNYEAIYFESEKLFKVKEWTNISFHAENKLIYWKDKTPD